MGDHVIRHLSLIQLLLVPTYLVVCRLPWITSEPVRTAVHSNPRVLSSVLRLNVYISAASEQTTKHDCPLSRFPDGTVYKLCTWQTMKMLMPGSTCKAHDEEQVVKGIWQQAASPPRVDGSLVFARWCHYLAVCTPHNTCFLGPTPVQIQNGCSIGSAVFAQLTVESPYTLQMGSHFSPHCPFA